MPDLSYSIRAAVPDDVDEVFGMIQDLAVYENLEHLLVASASDLKEALFVEKGTTRAIVVQSNGSSVSEASLLGYAIYFENFSTFLCRRGLYLEDLYVRPEARRCGIGGAMLKHLANIAVDRGYGRMEWTVLDWNQNAIDVYQSIGGDLLKEWRIVRLTGEGIEKLARR